MSSKQFLQQVTSYIRSKEARSHVEQELQQHMDHSTKAWISKGYSREEAEQKAISEMGSASQLGKSMDKIHRPKWDFWIIGAVLLLVAASFVPILTVDFSEIFGQEMNAYFVQNKIIHIVLAIGIIVALMFIDYRKLQRFSLPIYGVAILLFVMMLLIPNTTRNGEAMFRVGPIFIQAWTVLPLLLVAFAGFFTDRKWKLWQLTGLFLLPLYFIMKLPNLAVALLYMVVVAVLFSFSHFARKVKQTVFGVVGAINVAFILYSIYAYHYLLEPYQTVRIAAFLNPDLYATTEGYVMLQMKAALAGAGWFGAETVLKIPEAYTDYALIQLIQVYGYVAGIAVIAIILGIALRILWHARTMPQSFGKLLVIAAVTLYSVQSLYSILMVFGLLPLAGVPLPFISYGMTPLLLNAILIGLVLSVYRRKTYMMAHKMAS